MTRSTKTKRTDEPKLRVELFGAFSFYDYARFDHVGQMLQRPVIPGGLRYGRTQPYKHAFSPDARAAFDLFANDSALLFGTRDHPVPAFLAALERLRPASGHPRTG
jgi:hypothetical protein